MRWIASLFLLCGFLTSEVMAQTLPAELIRYADTVLHNGKIVTMDDKTTSTNPGTVVEALAIRDGKILALGKSKEILALKGSQTEVVDLKGKTVIPGIIDTHSHLMEYALRHWGGNVPELQWVRVTEKNWEKMKERTLEAIEFLSGEKKPGEWILIRLPRTVRRDGKAVGIKVAIIRDKILTKDELDKVSPKNPVLVRGRTRGILNSRALEEFRNHYGALDEVIDPSTGIYRSTTVMRSTQTDIVLKGNPELLADLYKKEQEEWAAYGVTTWSSSTSALSVVRAYNVLDRKGEMVIRFAYGSGAHVTGTSQGPAMVRGLMETVEGRGSDFLWLNGIGMASVDGSYPQIRSTAKAPPEIKGRELWRLDPGSHRRRILEAIIARGLRFTNTHTAGDATLDEVMNIIEEQSKKAGLTLEQIRAKRHVIDHCTMNPRPDQIPRLKKLGINMSCASKYVERSGKVLRDYGEKYTTWVSPVKTLIDGGVRTVLEIDTHRISRNGLFYYLELLATREVKRKIYAGKERIDRVQALKMATNWASEYVLKENVLGSLERGKWADVLVLTKDYFTVPQEEVSTVRPLLTMVGGKVVYEDPALRGKTVGYQVPGKFK